VNSGILAGIGLSAACGWNTFAPLLVLALADRMTSGDFVGYGVGSASDHPFAFIASLAGILVWLFLFSLELILDKIPRIDHILDVFGSVLRPATAALCFMAIGNRDHSIHPVLALFLGLVIGGVVHWDKARQRLALSQTGLGLGTPFVSMVEDGASLITAAMSLLLGILGPFVALASWFLIRAVNRWSATFGTGTVARARARIELRQ